MLDDVESTCENMVCLKEGKLVFDGRVDDFKKSVKKSVYEATIGRENNTVSDGISVISVKREGAELIIRFIVRDEELFQKSSICYHPSCRITDMTLEDAYFIKLFLQGSVI